MKIYLVGGAVRDKLLNHPIKEWDWVVVGATSDQLLQLGYKQVGKDFPVFLHPKTGDEYALARTERKVQPGYKGFTFDTTSSVTLADDLLRRDLTINAMAFDPETQTIIDPYGGQKDLQQHVLRHVSPAFKEDPVRILRVARFWARYAHLGFTVAPETLELMREMVNNGEANALVAERVWKEFERALAEKNPEKFFEVLAACGALGILFPHLKLDGPGIAALKAATPLYTSSSIRFAALLHAMPEDDSKTHTKETLTWICNRYRAPNHYRELALLVALHYEKIINSHLTAEELINFFSSVDIYRRPDRFQQFLDTCLAIALSQSKNFNAHWYVEAANTAKSVDIQELLAAGYENAALAKVLKEKRLEKINSWLRANQS